MDPLSPGEEEKPSAALRESWHRIFHSLLRMCTTFRKKKWSRVPCLPDFGVFSISFPSLSK